MKLIAALLGCVLVWGHAHAEVASPESTHPQLTLPTELAGGDYDPANPPRRIRVLVANGPTTFFTASGALHGVEREQLMALEVFLNRNRPAERPPTRLQFVPVEEGELLGALLAGRGDMAAGLLPVIDGVSGVRYSRAYLEDKWCVLRHRNSAPVGSIAALAGQRVVATKGSYARRLLSGVDIRWSEPEAAMNTEALLLAINRGGETITVASDYVYRLWKKRLPAIAQDVCLPGSVAAAWAVSEEADGLVAELDAYIAANPASARRAAQLTQRFLPADPLKGLAEGPGAGLDRLAILAPIFQTVAAANNLDWMLLAAIGQRESKLKPVVREKGPTGIMQVNPSTARKMGIKDPHGNEGNITAAARYLDYLRDQYDGPGIAPQDQLFFMLAAYNAGEGRLAQLRRQARKEGLDPNRWGGNVELIARRMVGQKLLDYVSSVNRFYMAYQASESEQQGEKVRSEHQSPR
ncbi:transglycosylase SLT domain-containing protein [Chitinibacteraceae bacterium HSL-7]